MGKKTSTMNRQPPRIKPDAVRGSFRKIVRRRATMRATSRTTSAATANANG
jgi:hypothetical protein